MSDDAIKVTPGVCACCGAAGTFVENDPETDEGFGTVPYFRVDDRCDVRAEADEYLTFIRRVAAGDHSGYNGAVQAAMDLLNRVHDQQKAAAGGEPACVGPTDE